MSFRASLARVAVLLFILAALAFSGARAQSSMAGAGSDGELATAIATARRTLPEFWQRWRANEPQETGYAVKVFVGDQFGAEQLWVSRLQGRDGRVHGIVDTRPLRTRFVQAGQRIDIRPDSIVDWMYFRNGRMVGNHTGRVMLKYLPPAEAEKLQLLFE